MAPLLGVGLLSLSQPHPGMLTAWSCAGPMQAAAASVSSQAWWSCHVQKTLFHYSPPGPLVLTVCCKKKLVAFVLNLSMAILEYTFIALTKVT